MRWELLLSLIFTGIDHLVTPQRYLAMMPGFVPFHAEIVANSRLCEVAGPVGLLIPKLRWLAGVMLAMYFVAVFFANMKIAFEGLNVQGLPAAQCYHWVRLLFQPGIIWWTFHAANVIFWPFNRDKSEFQGAP